MHLYVESNLASGSIPFVEEILTGTVSDVEFGWGGISVKT